MSWLAMSLLLLLAPLVTFSVRAQPANAAPAAYRLGIFPYLAPREIIKLYGPVVAAMERTLQRPVRLESAASFTAFSQAAASGSFDIALIQPFDYPEVVERAGMLPLARLSVPLVVQLYVRDDSRYRTIDDLRGTVVALPSPDAASSRVTLHALRDHRLVPGRDLEVRHFGAQDSCLQQVWAGGASACGTARPPVLVFERRMNAKLRAINDAPPVPHALFVVHPRVPAPLRARLQELVVGWDQTLEGRALLSDLAFPGFVVPTPGDYAPMRDYDKRAPEPAPGRAGEFTLGVVPYLSPRLLSEMYAPAQLALGRSIGATVLLRTATSFESFARDIDVARFDFVLIQPFDYGKAARQGYLALAQAKDHLQGEFYVRNASALHSLSDLRGQVVAMPPATSAVSRLARQALRQAGLVARDDVTLEYSKSHEGCLQRVQDGSAAACVSSRRVISMAPGRLGLGLRDVGSTESVPGVLFMVHRRVAAVNREAARREIAGWKQGDAALQALKLGEFVPADAAEYERLSPPVENR